MAKSPAGASVAFNTQRVWCLSERKCDFWKSDIFETVIPVLFRCRLGFYHHGPHWKLVELNLLCTARMTLVNRCEVIFCLPSQCIRHDLWMSTTLVTYKGFGWVWRVGWLSIRLLLLLKTVLQSGPVLGSQSQKSDFGFIFLQCSLWCNLTNYRVVIHLKKLKNSHLQSHLQLVWYN